MLYNKDWDQQKTLTPAELLRKAADQIETHGHAKGFLKITETAQQYNQKARDQKFGSMCIQGAMIEVLGTITGIPKHGLFDAAIGAIDLPYPRDERNHLVDVVLWNNARETTQEMVVSKLREAADRLERVA